MNIKEITIGTFLKFAGKLVSRLVKSAKIIAMCEPEIAKICTKPDLLKSSIFRSISVRSAKNNSLVNSVFRFFQKSLAWSIFCKISKLFFLIFSEKKCFLERKRS